jgi:RNA polymerase sigma-32 factor
MRTEPVFGGARLELLTQEEERALAREYVRTHDPKIEDRLVRSQLRLASHLARRYHLRDDECEDLSQQGALGVVEAVRRFDPERGIRLSSYAAWWIRAYQLRYLLANHRLVRLGSTQQQRKIFWGLARARARLREVGTEADVADLATALGTGAQETSETAQRMDARELSIDAPALGDGLSLGAKMASTDDSAEALFERAELLALVQTEANCLHDELSGRERTLFEARFREDAPTLAALGKEFGVSRERARQIEAKLLARLKTRVEHKLAA